MILQGFYFHETSHMLLSKISETTVRWVSHIPKDVGQFRLGVVWR